MDLNLYPLPNDEELQQVWDAIPRTSKGDVDWTKLITLMHQANYYQQMYLAIAKVQRQMLALHQRHEWQASMLTILSAHFLADWLLQNNWIAENKTNLRHPAMYCHVTLHLAAMLGFGTSRGLATSIAILHFLVDTRIPLTYWNYVSTGPPAMVNGQRNPMKTHVDLWRDQALHFLIIYLCARAHRQGT